MMEIDVPDTRGIHLNMIRTFLILALILFHHELPAAPSLLKLIQGNATLGAHSIRFQGVLFHEKNHRLRVIDNPDGRYKGLVDALKTQGCVAGINGGYFHPDGTPLGLLVSGGKKIHGLERSRLLGGIVGTTPTSLFLVRYQNYKYGPKTLEALQAGPMLVENSSAVKGLNNKKSARRSVVATDGAGRWALLLTSSETLAGVAQALEKRNLMEDFSIQRALNLDGGSSCGLWIRGSDRDFHVAEAKGVRNYLGVVGR